MASFLQILQVGSCTRVSRLGSLFLSRSSLLDACYPGLKSRYSHGTRYLSHCHIVRTIPLLGEASALTLVAHSGMIMQLLAGANLVEVDFSVKEDRALFGGAQKRASALISRSLNL